MGKNIMPLNDKRQLHGYCERYYYSGQLLWKGVKANGARCGCHKAYYVDGSVHEDYAGYFFNEVKVSDNNEKGYCYIWGKFGL